MWRFIGLLLYLAICPWGISSSRSQCIPNFFCPKSEVSFDEGSASIVSYRLGDLKEVDPFFDCSKCCLITSVSNRIDHNEPRESFNNQQTMNITVALRVERALNVSVYSTKGYGVVFNSSSGPSFLSLGLRVVLASDAISCKSAKPVNHARPVVDSLNIAISFRHPHVTTHFVLTF